MDKRLIAALTLGVAALVGAVGINYAHQRDREEIISRLPEGFRSESTYSREGITGLFNAYPCGLFNTYPSELDIISPISEGISLGIETDFEGSLTDLFNQTCSQYRNQLLQEINQRKVEKEVLPNELEGHDIVVLVGNYVRANGNLDKLSEDAKQLYEQAQAFELIEHPVFNRDYHLIPGQEDSKSLEKAIDAATEYGWINDEKIYNQLLIRAKTCLDGLKRCAKDYYYGAERAYQCNNLTYGLEYALELMVTAHDK